MNEQPKCAASNSIHTKLELQVLSPFFLDVASVGEERREREAAGNFGQPLGDSICDDVITSKCDLYSPHSRGPALGGNPNRV